jgi:hypothetical protein
MIDKEIYKKGSRYFKRIVDEFRDLSFGKPNKYNFVQVYYKTPVYKYHILNIPLNLPEVNYADKISKNRLNHQSYYEEVAENGKLDSVKNHKDFVRGYWGSRYKIAKRFYMIRNHQEALKYALQNSKNMV